MNPQNEIKHLKNFNNSLAVRVDECLQEISTLRTQLKSVEAERDEANAGAAVMREALELDSPYPVFDVLEKSASWLGNLQIIHDCDCHGHEVIQTLRLAAQHQSEAIKKSLATNAGKSLLERLKRYETALEELSELGGGRSEGNQIALRALNQ